MPSKIRILDEVTINQIAAGEVIENPASVVKELVENALDAGSTRVAIEIKAGGFQLISISDNGEGMSADDALLAFERHGTSKIKKVDDLSVLDSLGFRGEALASILSVAQVTLLTCDGNETTRVEGAGGRVLKVEKGTRAQGTTIEVRSLFYNVPARREFQKSTSRSTAEITKMVTKLALAYPHVSFTLISNEGEIFSVKESELEARARALLGEEFLHGSNPITFETKGLKLEGLLGSPLATRTNRTGQYLFLNRRSILCLPISYGIEEGYGTRLTPRNYPQFLLHLTLPPSDVDVNVHPQKKEVRLKEEEWIKEALRDAVSRTWSPAFVADEDFFLAEEREESPKPTFYAVAEPKRWAGPPPVSQSESSFTEEAPLFVKPSYEIMGLYQHFLFVKEEEVLVLVDLKEASRGLIEKSGGEPLPKQTLLIPLTFEFSIHESLRLQEELEILGAMGIGIRPFGERHFIVESLCDLISADSVEALLHEYLATKDRAKALKRGSAARKRAFTLPEARLLYEKVRGSEAHCLIKLGDKELEKIIQTH